MLCEGGSGAVSGLLPLGLQEIRFETFVLIFSSCSGYPAAVARRT